MPDKQLKQTSEIPVISRDRLINDLKSLGVARGDHVGLGISFKSIGRVEGGPEAFIETLLESVGTEGTIMIPTYTKYFHLSMIQMGLVDYIFDYRSTQATTGLMSEMIRKHSASVRSKHPTNSIAAIGGYSAFLTGDHNENAHAYMPYSKLAQINGKILSIGIGDKLVGIRHEAQYLAGLLDVVPFRCGVQYRDKKGEIQLFVRKDKGGCTKMLPELGNVVLRKNGLVRDGMIGMARSILVPARETLELMTDVLKNNPTINLCDDILCLWCREVERRMDLYGKIEKPRFFQKNIIIYGILALINKLRLADYRFYKLVKKVS